jgi:hypothetical protein
MYFKVVFTLSCSFILRGVHYGMGHHDDSLPVPERIQGLKVHTAPFDFLISDRSPSLMPSPVPSPSNTHLRSEHDVHKTQHRHLPPADRNQEAVYVDPQNQHGNRHHLVTRYLLLRNLPMHTCTSTMGLHYPELEMCFRGFFRRGCVRDLCFDSHYGLDVCYHSDTNDLVGTVDYSKEGHGCVRAVAWCLVSPCLPSPFLPPTTQANTIPVRV